MNTILITGVNGQIGRELLPALLRTYPDKHLVGIGRTPSSNSFISQSSIQTSSQEERYKYQVLDVRDNAGLTGLVEQYNVSCVYHLASLLSAKGEQNPSLCWDININGLINLLKLAKKYRFALFWPSSIAVFGPKSPKVSTPQSAITDPTTMYGLTKVTGERLCQYYVQQYQVNVRSLRLPGIISHRMRPGGGTTDYAVNMFYSAAASQDYDCFVTPDTRLPLSYMPDCINAIKALMQANLPPAFLSYNLTSFSPSAAELVQAIQQHHSQFRCHYQPDYRQAIADSWPDSIDDTAARQDWGWQPQYSLTAMAQDMIAQLTRRCSHGDLNPTPVSVTT